MTTIYISRHSIPFKEHRGIELISEDNLTWNKMSPLSVNGEKMAEKLSKYKKLNDIDIVYSSEYVRAMSTAKYIAKNNNLKVNIDERLGERKHGLIPENMDYNEYHLKQILEKTYKLPEGENQVEVRNRMLASINEILDKHKNKNIFICSHSTALTFLFMNWCNYDKNNNKLIYKNKVIFDMKWNAPELFRLEFDKDNNLTNIQNIKDF